MSHRDNARKLRKEPTQAERKLWRHLRLKQFHGFKFRRQFVIGSYIVDFACPERKLIVEVDGGQHLESAPDKTRTDWLNSQGFRVLRFWNNDVLQNIEAVKMVIWENLTPHLNPPPQGGRKTNWKTNEE